MTNLPLSDLTHPIPRQQYDRPFLSDVPPQQSDSRAARVPVTFRRPTNGNYFVRVGLGTPPQQLLLMLDTGSEVSWTQCQPCAHLTACYPQPDPIFDPAFSSSYRQVPCSSPLCDQLQFSGSLMGCSSNSSDDERCLYMVDYADRSVTQGDFAVERLQIGEQTLYDFPFGCGHDNQGLLKGMDGLLALGRGPLALPNQTSSIFSGRFAYCLPFFLVKESAGFIEFGVEISAGQSFTPLVEYENEPAFYTVRATDITVGDIPVTVASPSSHYVVVDSGTTITHLAPSIYETVRDDFRQATAYLSEKRYHSVFDTCYDLSYVDSIQIPLLSFKFQNGLDFTIPAKNMVVPVDKHGTYCFAFLPSHDDVTVLGNYQQQGFRFMFDLPAGKLTIDDESCSESLGLPRMTSF